MRTLSAVALVAVAVLSTRAFAIKVPPVQLRLFGGVVSSDPKDLNEELAANSLKTFKNFPQFGAEASHTLGPFEFGLRGTYRIASQDEDPSNDSTEYRVSFKQTTAALMLHFPFINSNLVRTEFFGGFGGSNTEAEIRSASQEGQWNKKDSADWFAQPWSLYGAAVAVGYKKFYFFVEGGFEQNKVKDLKRTGTVNTNVEELDLSGGFFNVGIMFNGLSPKKK